jgi:hypothetical protein
VPGAGHLLDQVVALVGDVEVAAAVDGETGGIADLGGGGGAFGGPARAPGFAGNDGEPAFGGDLLDDGVGPVGNVEVAV